MTAGRSVPGEVPSRTPNPERKAQTRQRLLDGALHAFSRTGFHDTSVDAIVQESGASKGAFYFHFPSKEDLFLALMNSLADRLAREVDAAVATRQTPMEQLDAALATVVDLFTRHRTIGKVFLVDVPTQNRAFARQVRAIHDRFVTLIQGHIDAAIDAGAVAPLDSAIVARMWMGAVTEVVTWWLENPRAASPERIRATVRETLLRSLTLPASPAPAGSDDSGKDLP